MSSRAFYAAGWRLRVLAAALRSRALAPVRRLLAARALAPLSDDAGLSDAGLSDAGLSDAGLSDAGLSDAGLGWPREDGPREDGPREDGPREDGPREDGPRAAHDLVAAYRSGRTTPRVVAERALEAAAALDRGSLPLRAFVHLDARDVRAQADASTARWRAGRALGPLDGVPVAVKDELDVAGQPTTCGTAFLGRTPATEDAAAVARLRAAGAVLFGKTNMPELGMGPSGLNVHHGAARNPLDPERDSGGSSAGSAVAVAAGVVPIALGTDSGGSLRVPGSLCGVAALKGTFGRVPTRGIATPLCSVLHAGALGACVRDVATASALLASDPGLARALDRARRPALLRVGTCDRLFRDARGDVGSLARAAVERLLARDAIEVPIELPSTDVVIALGLAVLGGEAAAAFPPELARGLGPEVGVTLDLARGISPAQHARARHARAGVARALERAFARADVIVVPTTLITAPRYRADALQSGAIDEDLARALTAATLAACLAGVPAAQVPCGHDRGGMPVGLQIIAARGRDALALQVAAEVERHVAWRRPAIWFDLLA